MSNNKLNALLDEEHIKILFSIFKSKNIALRLVGGGIRDFLINREIRDIDSSYGETDKGHFIILLLFLVLL